MKWLSTTAVIAVLAGATALGPNAVAQNTAPAANPHPSTPAIANPNGNNPGAPAAGSNSFTEAQAKSRIESAGYSNVCDEPMGGKMHASAAEGAKLPSAGPPTCRKVNNTVAS